MKTDIKKTNNRLIVKIFTENHFEKYGHCCLCNKFQQQLYDEISYGLCYECSNILKKEIIEYLAKEMDTKVDDLEKFLFDEKIELLITLTNKE